MTPEELNGKFVTQNCKFLKCSINVKILECLYFVGCDLCICLKLLFQLKASSNADDQTYLLVFKCMYFWPYIK